MTEITAIDFDEAWYLATYDDIRRAIEAGGFKDGLDHYTKFGAAEGRLPHPPSTLSDGEAYQTLRAAQTDGGVLEALGVRHGADTSSPGRDGLRTYERLFAPFRDSLITVLAIGVADGAALRLWEEYFPRAIIVGLDNRQDSKRHEGGRRLVEIAARGDTEALRQLGARYTPTIVIDDGPQGADFVRASFETLYSALQKGGLYIAHDLSAHGGAAASYLKLANRVACPHDAVDVDGAIAAMTETVEFLENAVAVRRRR